VLKNLEKFERIPEKIKDKIFEKVFKISEFQKLTKSERDAYEDSLKYYRDLKNSLDTAFDEGKAEAEKELLPIIEEERRQKRELQYKTAKELLAEGFSTQRISQITDLPLEEIEKLRS